MTTSLSDDSSELNTQRFISAIISFNIFMHNQSYFYLRVHEIQGLITYFLTICTQVHLRDLESERTTMNASHQQLSDTLKTFENRFAELEKDLLSQKVDLASAEDKCQQMQKSNSQLTELVNRQRYLLQTCLHESAQCTTN